MQRLDRRLTILRGKRNGAFDPNQYYMERALRTRVARKVRALLRGMVPVVLVTPRWSQAQRFLDDIGVDLLLGEPAVRTRTLSLLPLQGRTQHQAWAWLVQAVMEFCKLEVDEGPAWQAVSRHGFRHVMADLFRRAEHGERRCLMIHGLEHMNVEALRDLITVFEDHLADTGDDRSFNLLIAGSVDAPHFDFEEGERVVLNDFSEIEAIEVLVEHVGPVEAHRLSAVVDLVGGVPAILDALGVEATRLSEVVADREAVWRVLGSLALEIRQAFEIVAADDRLSTRIELLCREGPQVPDADCDPALVSAGLIKEIGFGTGRRMSMRAPVFADLALVDMPPETPHGV